MTPADRLWKQCPEGYQASTLHAPDRDFRETNCYVDVWIEVLHAMGLDPTACLGFTLGSDFEGDQWTFFKPPHADLAALYEIHVEELTLWKPLLEHAQMQVARGRLPLVEVDSYFLPDTSGTDYRRQHVKTTIAITSVDPDARELIYFHNTGFHRLQGDDFDRLFRPGPSERDDYLPPYCEIIKPERARVMEPHALREASLSLARQHYQRRPRENPVAVHGASFSRDVETIATGGLGVYHAYSFAVLRQLGASFDLASTYMRWLADGREEEPFVVAAESFAGIAATAKMLILKLARVANAGRPRDLSASFEEMAEAWDRGMDHAGRALGPLRP